MPGAWKTDPARCSQVQSLGLTLLQEMGGSLAGQLEVRSGESGEAVPVRQ